MNSPTETERLEDDTVAREDPRAWGKHALDPLRAQVEEDALELEQESEVEPLPDPSEEDVERFCRKIPFAKQAIGVEFTRCGGAQPTNLPSFPDSVEFLKPMSPYIAWQTHGEANYIGVAYYADWIRNTVGDTALAEALDPYGATDEAMGLQLANIRPILRVRLKQFKRIRPDLFTQ